MTLDDIGEIAARDRLMVMGAFHPGEGDDLPGDILTLVMLGPAEPGFWAHVTAEAEWDGEPDPIDRWSRRVIGRMACDLGGKAYFPFGGPPYRPFIRWAKRTGRAWASPVTILVHDTAGLMVSYRGAIGLRERLELPPPPAGRPCEACATKPCLTACPAAALTGDGYDVPACHAFLDTEAGRDCMTGGCRVRRACPVSQGYGRVAGQSAYHMSLFHP